MAEWLFEAGIGEDRAILVEDGTILEAAIELPGALRVGSIVQGKLQQVLIPGRRAIVGTGEGEALMEPIPAGLSEGQAIRIEIVREAIPEAGRAKLAKCRSSDAEPRNGPSLRQRLPGARTARPGEDPFEAAGWSELLEEAATGEIAFQGGALRISLTPAMTLIDVDGSLPPEALAVAGAGAAGRAIRRLGIGGSIGIDLPTLSAKPDRQAAAAALDVVLPQPFERTAVNGFGFLQVVRRRERVSLPELLQGDPIGASARALLRRAERAPGSGERTLSAHPIVAAKIETNPQWLEALARRLGAPVRLQADPSLAISAGHVHAAFP
ncbi:MAG: ribonuclease [Alphaproteobacteria bacterium]|nr:MAG: ribonuclease [Alphaproteobacteria bacterium]